MNSKYNSTFIIAEVGSVHDGSFGNATKLIEAAAECGVDAVKFQAHISEAETLPDAPMPPYFKGEPRFEYFRRTGFSLDQWKELKSHCDDHNVIFLSSPFSEEAVDLLESVGVPQYKIPSGEVTNLPMLEKIARLGKPVILSSGMSAWDELDRAVGVIQKYNQQLTVLQCTSEYPCPYEQVGLNVMMEMAERYQVPVGLSDHTLTNYAVFAAVTLGAAVIEKHFTFSRKMYGSDALHSLEPVEMTDLVQGVQAIEAMMANPVEKDWVQPYAEMKRIFEKSLVAQVDISAGTVLTRDLIGIKKPGTGISAARVDEFLGKKVCNDILSGEIFAEDDFFED
ncbi:MAG: N-acetylneuraminate synthase family protein [Anaerolineales bacterium]|nr:N-acetylneuraminate synthase family protein [Chloroflexota bacterium]MBL6980215.1 N-acetylneuraminate synthase family protein [Anaerolineales bacterium]